MLSDRSRGFSIAIEDAAALDLAVFLWIVSKAENKVWIIHCSKERAMRLQDAAVKASTNFRK